MSDWKPSPHLATEVRFQTPAGIKQHKPTSVGRNARLLGELTNARIAEGKRLLYLRRFTEIFSISETIFNTRQRTTSFGDFKRYSWKTSTSKVKHAAFLQSPYRMRPGAVS